MDDRRKDGLKRQACKCEKPAPRMSGDDCGRCGSLIMSCHHCGGKADGLYFTQDRRAPAAPMRDHPMCAAHGVSDSRFIRGKTRVLVEGYP